MCVAGEGVAVWLCGCVAGWLCGWLAVWLVRAIGFDCVMYTLHCILCTVYCMLYTVFCVLCSVYCIPCTVYCILYTVYCTLNTEYCILCIVLIREIFTALQAINVDVNFLCQSPQQEGVLANDFTYFFMPITTAAGRFSKRPIV